MTTFTERYILAATRGVPEKSRADLRAELEVSIRDAIDARIEAGEEQDAAERAVLTDLGDPDKLAAGYTEAPTHLIGPRYYFEWLRLLKLLLWIVPACAAFGIALGQTLAGAPFGEIVGTTVAGVIGVVVHLCFWVTLVFALLERSPGKSPLEQGALTKDGPWAAWSLDQLPEPPVSGAKFTDAIATVICLLLGAGAILWDQFIGFVPGRPELSFLDPGLWPWWIAGLFAIMSVQAVLAIVLYRAGRWTNSLAVVNAIIHVVLALPAIWLITQDRLINHEFWSTLIQDDPDKVATILNIVTGFGIATIAVWAIIDAFLKARRAR